MTQRASSTSLMRAGSCSFLAGKTYYSFLEDPVLGHAAVRLLEIIGEAAFNTTSATRDAHPDVPWRDIIGTRHRLVHGYFAVDMEIVWETATAKVPVLLALLEPFVPPENGEEDAQ